MKYIKLIISKVKKELQKVFYRNLYKKRSCLKGTIKREKCKSIEDVLTTHFKNYNDDNPGTSIDTLFLALPVNKKHFCSI